MINFIRIRHKFLYNGRFFYCWDLTVEDFILLNIDLEEWIKKILLEFNKNLPELNWRQINEFLNILLGVEKKEKNIIDKITETEKKFKKKEEKKENDILEDFHIIEWIIMRNLKQPLSEIRKWNYLYFMEIYKDLNYIINPEQYDPKRKSQSPDKKKFKKELWEYFK